MNESMRICWLSVSDQLGGSEHVLVQMVRALRRARPQWRLHAILPGPGALGQHLETAGCSVTVVEFPPALARLGESAAVRDGWSAGSQLALSSQLASVWVTLHGYERRLRRAVCDFAPDVIHTNGLKAHVLGARLRAHATLVWHLHEYVSERRVTRLLLRRYLRRCDALIANSWSVAADAESVFSSLPPLTVLHNAVDLDEFAAEGPTADLDALSGLSAEPRAVRVGLVGTFGHWKGHDVFIEALRRVVNATAVPVRGFIIGDRLYDTTGSQFTRSELEALIATSGLQDRVALTGFMNSATAMRSLDVVVHASRKPEPFGLVIAEAMACGRAVITTASGGAAELVTPGEDALVAAAGDADALATAILRLVANPELRHTLGARARATALERFDAGRMAAGLATVYEQTIPQLAPEPSV